jgi:hypothetical protein
MCFCPRMAVQRLSLVGVTNEGDKEYLLFKDEEILARLE